MSYLAALAGWIAAHAWGGLVDVLHWLIVRKPK